MYKKRKNKHHRDAWSHACECCTLEIIMYCAHELPEYTNYTVIIQKNALVLRQHTWKHLGVKCYHIISNSNDIEKKSHTNISRVTNSRVTNLGQKV